MPSPPAAATAAVALRCHGRRGSRHTRRQTGTRRIGHSRRADAATGTRPRRSTKAAGPALPTACTTRRSRAGCSGPCTRSRGRSRARRRRLHRPPPPPPPSRPPPPPPPPPRLKRGAANAAAAVLGPPRRLRRRHAGAVVRVASRALVEPTIVAEWVRRRALGRHVAPRPLARHFPPLAPRAVAMRVALARARAAVVAHERGAAAVARGEARARRRVHEVRARLVHEAPRDAGERVAPRPAQCAPPTPAPSMQRQPRALTRGPVAAACARGGGGDGEAGGGGGGGGRRCGGGGGGRNCGRRRQTVRRRRWRPQFARKLDRRRR